MAASDRKIAEGLEHLNLAEKCMKTGIFKWKPDYDGAVAEYTKAAIAFKNAKASEQAVNSYLKAADVHRHTGSLFHAAKAYESAAMIVKEIKDFAKAAEFVEKASNLYIEHGTRDTAAIALERAAKMLDPALPDESIRLYFKASDIYEVEDNPRMCAEMIGKASRIQLRLRRLEDAAKSIEKEIDFYSQEDCHAVINKLVMGLVLVHLHRDDYVAADQVFKSACNYSGFPSSEEAGGVEGVLSAYEQGDQEAATEIVRSPLFRYMENEFTKLARDLVVPGGHAVVPGGTGVSAEDDTEDDPYAGGLL